MAFPHVDGVGPQPEIADTMGEVFRPCDFDCLAWNIHNQVLHRTRREPLRVVELGTWSGQSTLAIAQPNVLLHCISSWEAGNDSAKVRWCSVKAGDDGRPSAGNLAFQQFIVNTAGTVFRTAFPLICCPLGAADWWPEKLDAVFINGDLAADGLRRLVCSWKKRVRPHGAIYGVYKDHTVEALTNTYPYSTDGTIWRHRVSKEVRP